VKYLQPSCRSACARYLLMLGVLFVSAAWSSAQTFTPEDPSAFAVVKSVRMVQAHDGPAVEIVTTKPVIPSIVLLLRTPPRVVIDLPRARLDIKQKRISIRAHQITTLRADQYQENPPVTRVVVDLVVARAYTWAASGNRLLVHLGKDPEVQTARSPFQSPTVASLAPAAKPVAVVTAPLPTGGPFALVGSGMVSGSSITAGADTALLRLARGGEVHVCPGTTVSVTPSQNGHNIMFGMNTGALEAHYVLDSSSDSVMTPDFRILLSGPGEFHYAISSDNRGNACVRALPGNTASAIVSELMGDRSYEVKANDQLVFHLGQLEKMDKDVPLECGCPPPRQPVLRATNPARESDSKDVNLSGKPNSPVIASIQPSGNVPASPEPTPSSDKSAVHLQVEAPMVFRAGDAPPAPITEARTLPADSRPDQALALSTPLPPAPLTDKPVEKKANTATAQHKSFFKRIFSIFR